MRIYRAWEVDRAQFRFLRIPSNFPRYARTRFGCSRRRSRSPCPREKHSTSPLEQQWRSTAHAGGEFIENNFPRRARSFACSLSDHTRTRRYERVRTHTDAWESRVGYLPRMHRANCSVWIFIRLVWGESRRRDGNDDRKNPAWKKVLRASKTGHVHRHDSISLLNATEKASTECPWCSCSSDIWCGPLVTLWVTKRTSFSVTLAEHILNGYRAISTTVNDAHGWK